MYKQSNISSVIKCKDCWLLKSAAWLVTTSQQLGSLETLFWITDSFVVRKSFYCRLQSSEFA